MTQSNKRTPDLSGASPNHPKPISEFIDEVLNDLVSIVPTKFENKMDLVRIRDRANQALLTRIEEEVTAAEDRFVSNFEKLLDGMVDYYRVNLWNTYTPTPEQKIGYEQQKQHILHLAKQAALHHKDTDHQLNGSEG